MRHLLPALLLLALPLSAAAQATQTLAPVSVPEWKAVYGRIEARDSIPARARIGGTLMDMSVTEGDLVAAGQTIARVRDEKIDFQLSAIDAQLQALESQLENAEAELRRGEALLERGVTTAQRLDGLRTQVDVLTSQIEAARADRRVVVQQAAEGDVLAPIAGRVLSVPLATGAVIMPGEPVATVGGGGVFLRLAVPERHRHFLKEGDAIQITLAGDAVAGQLARIYPQIENGRVIADVEVPGLADDFIDARVLVRLPVGESRVLVVPPSAITSRAGLDFVTVSTPAGPVLRNVVLGAPHDQGIEVLTGLRAGDEVVIGHD